MVYCVPTNVPPKRWSNVFWTYWLRQRAITITNNNKTHQPVACLCKKKHFQFLLAPFSIGVTATCDKIDWFVWKQIEITTKPTKSIDFRCSVFFLALSRIAIDSKITLCVVWFLYTQKPKSFDIVCITTLNNGICTVFHPTDLAWLMRSARTTRSKSEISHVENSNRIAR